jgi:AraC-like DNA-binding protein
LQRKDIIREDLLAYISDNLDKSLNVEKLAAQVALSSDYFARRFKKETGYTPHQYVLLSRINAAKHFLKSGNLTVKEVAFSCGFSSESGFCISFKHVMGMSPTDYRESLAVENES